MTPLTLAEYRALQADLTRPVTQDPIGQDASRRNVGARHSDLFTLHGYTHTRRPVPADQRAARRRARKELAAMLAKQRQERYG